MDNDNIQAAIKDLQTNLLEMKTAVAVLHAVGSQGLRDTMNHWIQRDHTVLTLLERVQQTKVRQDARTVVTP